MTAKYDLSICYQYERESEHTLAELLFHLNFRVNGICEQIKKARRNKARKLSPVQWDGASERTGQEQNTNAGNLSQRAYKNIMKTTFTQQYSQGMIFENYE